MGVGDFRGVVEKGMAFGEISRIEEVDGAATPVLSFQEHWAGRLRI